LKTIIALAHLADSRNDFFLKRENIANEEIKKLDWIREAFDVIESCILRSKSDVFEFVEQIKTENASSLLIHLPIWADPILGVTLASMADLPTLVIGNSRQDSSSIVGMLGLGGSLNQIGILHQRIFNMESSDEKKKVTAFLNAANCAIALKGKTLGLFGGRSLGIFTAVADPAQWQMLFGIDIQYIDQYEIVLKSKEIADEKVEQYITWFLDNLKGITYGGIFNEDKLKLQIRSYLATKELIKQHKLDFVGVKCQPELSDGFVSQCVSHCLSNSSFDAEGDKKPVVHACESDADGALSMEILHLISGGKPSALLDIRWFDPQENIWTLANCGAIALDFFKNEDSEGRIDAVEITPHVFGEGGGGALPGIIRQQDITLARLCRVKLEYVMHIMIGSTILDENTDLSKTTSAFPQAFVSAKSGFDFLQEYGSNHIHIVNGNYVEDLVFLCKILNINYKVWD
jgi:L-fucose/D-arabinose isomerase